MVVFCALFLGAPPSIAQEVIQSASELDSPPHSIVTLAVLGALRGPRRRKTHCKRGHARTPENLTNGGACKLCAKSYKRGS